MSNPRIWLVHWNQSEAQERTQQLHDHGFRVQSGAEQGHRLFRMLEEGLPDAILIDLTRVPSQGRDLGVALRIRKGTRFVPLVFVGGAPEKVKQIRQVLPDANYCEWEGVEKALKSAIDSDLDNVVVPESVFAAYTSKSLSTKLGLKAAMRFVQINAPDGFESGIAELPDDISVIRRPDPSADLAIWFVGSVEDLNSNLSKVVEISKKMPIWIAWPKIGSDLQSDLTQPIVRKICMDRDMVDYKICSIDDTWSALLFTWRG